MRLGIPKETTPGEQRVALVPETVARLGSGVDVIVEAGAGEAAGFLDAAYTEAGAQLGDPWSADVVAKVATPTAKKSAATKRPAAKAPASKSAAKKVAKR